MDVQEPPRAPVATRRVHDGVRHPRLARELRTLELMTRLYCRDVHRSARPLCGDCRALVEYATRRLDRCVFGDDKPTCANCRVHCYNAHYGEAIRTVMRYAGPRMIFAHPLLAIAHLLDGRRPAPALPKRSAAPKRSNENADR